MANCPHCDAQVSLPIYSQAQCPKCGALLHCCKCCAFYSPDSHYGCRESIEEPIWDKEKSNYCDYFRLTDKKIGSSKDAEKAQKARQMLDSLFNI
ncbi:MAG: hypothetical protein HUK23_04090 [Sphaerochaetaceae bacterium]|nr:hypothetical protein [Sphaerochaetaceae bacterium]